jgi:hypothetical protein
VGGALLIFHYSLFIDFFLEVAMKGITGITKGRAALTVPPDTPPNEVWRYGLGFPFQVAPRKAALFCNIRRDGTHSVDLEIGSDVVLFDDLSDIRAGNAIPLSRYEMTASSLTRKGPVLGGFVPLGAKLADGSPHPHAGTGFGMSWAIRHTLDETGNFDHRLSTERHAELFQFVYNGTDFRVLDKESVKAETLLSKWNLMANFITNAIPDGQDLFFVMVAKTGDVTVAGLSRWQAGVYGWRPVSFVPVTGEEVSWFEPSLIRDTDGSLLFSARSDWRAWPEIAFDVVVWRSIDNGKTWEQVIYRKNYRAQSTVSINQAADGTPFVVANLPPLHDTREVLCYCPLNVSRTDFTECLIVRDLPEELGPPPSGSWWRIDHPNSAIVRLKDGKWHSLLIYRIVDNMEIMGDAGPAPQTGCYVEEVFSRGEAIPAWDF